MTYDILLQLQSRLNITRRWMRLFRFLPTLNASYTLYTSKTGTLDTWVDVVGKSCLGMFGLLESVTLVDLIQVNGLEIMGLEKALALNVDAQVFWFLGLACSVVSTSLKLSAAYQSEPYMGKVKKNVAQKAPVSPTKENVDVNGYSEKFQDVIKELKGLKNAGEVATEDIVEEKEINSGKGTAKESETCALFWKLLADGLDLTLPGTTLGWFPFDSGKTGLAMWITSVITGLDVWRRIGIELEAKT